MTSRFVSFAPGCNNRLVEYVQDGENIIPVNTDLTPVLMCMNGRNVWRFYSDNRPDGVLLPTYYLVDDHPDLAARVHQRRLHQQHQHIQPQMVINLPSPPHPISPEAVPYMQQPQIPGPSFQQGPYFHPYNVSPGPQQLINQQPMQQPQQGSFHGPLQQMHGVFQGSGPMIPQQQSPQAYQSIPPVHQQHGSPEFAQQFPQLGSPGVAQPVLVQGSPGFVQSRTQLRNQGFVQPMPAHSGVPGVVQTSPSSVPTAMQHPVSQPQRITLHQVSPQQVCIRTQAHTSTSQDQSQQTQAQQQIMNPDPQVTPQRRFLVGKKPSQIPRLVAKPETSSTQPLPMPQTPPTITSQVPGPQSPQTPSTPTTPPAQHPIPVTPQTPGPSSAITGQSVTTTPPEFRTPVNAPLKRPRGSDETPPSNEPSPSRPLLDPSRSRSGSVSSTSSASSLSSVQSFESLTLSEVQPIEEQIKLRAASSELMLNHVQTLSGFKQEPIKDGITSCGGLPIVHIPFTASVKEDKFFRQVVTFCVHHGQLMKRHRSFSQEEPAHAYGWGKLDDEDTHLMNLGDAFKDAGNLFNKYADVILASVGVNPAPINSTLARLDECGPSNFTEGEELALMGLQKIILDAHQRVPSLIASVTSRLESYGFNLFRHLIPPQELFLTSGTTYYLDLLLGLPIQSELPPTIKVENEDVNFKDVARWAVAVITNQPGSHQITGKNENFLLSCVRENANLVKAIAFGVAHVEGIFKRFSTNGKVQICELSWISNPTDAWIQGHVQRLGWNRETGSSLFGQAKMTMKNNRVHNLEDYQQIKLQTALPLAMAMKHGMIVANTKSYSHAPTLDALRDTLEIRDGIRQLIWDLVRVEVGNTLNTACMRAHLSRSCQFATLRLQYERTGDELLYLLQQNTSDALTPINRTHPDPERALQELPMPTVESGPEMINYSQQKKSLEFQLKLFKQVFVILTEANGKLHYNSTHLNGTPYQFENRNLPLTLQECELTKENAKDILKTLRELRHSSEKDVSIHFGHIANDSTESGILKIIFEEVGTDKNKWEIPLRRIQEYLGRQAVSVEEIFRVGRIAFMTHEGLIAGTLMRKMGLSTTERARELKFEYEEIFEGDVRSEFLCMMISCYVSRRGLKLKQLITNPDYRPVLRILLHISQERYNFLTAVLDDLQRVDKILTILGRLGNKTKILRVMGLNSEERRLFGAFCVWDGPAMNKKTKMYFNALLHLEDKAKMVLTLKSTYAGYKDERTLEDVESRFIAELDVHMKSTTFPCEELGRDLRERIRGAENVWPVELRQFGKCTKIGCVHLHQYSDVRILSIHASHLPPHLFLKPIVPFLNEPLVERVEEYINSNPDPRDLEMIMKANHQLICSFTKVFSSSRIWKFRSSIAAFLAKERNTILKWPLTPPSENHRLYDTSEAMYQTYHVPTGKNRLSARKIAKINIKKKTAVKEFPNVKSPGNSQHHTWAEFEKSKLAAIEYPSFSCFYEAPVDGAGNVKFQQLAVSGFYPEHLVDGGD